MSVTAGVTVAASALLLLLVYSVRRSQDEARRARLTGLAVPSAKPTAPAATVPYQRPPPRRQSGTPGTPDGLVKTPPPRRRGAKPAPTAPTLLPPSLLEKVADVSLPAAPSDPSEPLWRQRPVWVGMATALVVVAVTGATAAPALFPLEPEEWTSAEQILFSGLAGAVAGCLAWAASRYFEARRRRGT
jgi:hypothetical protein